MANGDTLLWYRAAGTDPRYQGRGAFTVAFDQMVDPDWITTFGPQTYMLYRTPNPVVYEAVRKLWGRYPEWDARLQPRITPDGGMEPIDDAKAEEALAIAGTLWPDCELDTSTFVLKDFLDKYGQDIWRVPMARSSDEGVNRFFAEHIRPGNRDALICFTPLFA
jgi:hypothetical protein